MTSNVAVKFEQVDLSDQKLSLDYRVTNSGDVAVYVVRILCQGWDEEDHPLPDPEGVYRRVEGDRLVLAKTIIPVPQDIDLEVVQYPLFQKLDPGDSLTDSFSIDLPTREYSPHDYEDPEVAAEPIEIAWLLEIGFVLQDDLDAVTPVSCEAADGTPGLQIFAFNPEWLQVVRAEFEKPISFQPTIGELENE